MGFADVRRAIEERFKTNWADVAPILYDNSESDIRGRGTWVTLIINEGPGDQITVSNDSPLHRFLGSVIVQIRTPEDQGVGTAYDLADKADIIFRRQVITFGDSGKITFRTPGLQRVGNRDGVFWLNVLAPYQRDITYS